MVAATVYSRCLFGRNFGLLYSQGPGKLECILGMVVADTTMEWQAVSKAVCAGSNMSWCAPKDTDPTPSTRTLNS